MVGLVFLGIFEPYLEFIGVKIRKIVEKTKNTSSTPINRVLNRKKWESPPPL
jgi:hypothetical protein